MNQRAIELYQQAVTFAYNTAGDDAGKGTILESLTAGKFAELIVAECIQQSLAVSHRDDDMGAIIADRIREHFGVKE